MKLNTVVTQYIDILTFNFVHYKNLSPVTVTDGIFWSQGGLFTQYRGSVEVLQKQSPESWKLPSVPVTSDSFFFLHIILKIKIGINGFNICVNKCTIFL